MSSFANQAKQIRRLFTLLGNLYGQLIEKLGLKAQGNYAGPFWSSNFLACLWESSKNLNLYDFGIVGRVLEPQNQYYVFLETPGYLNSSKKMPNHFQK